MNEQIDATQQELLEKQNRQILRKLEVTPFSNAKREKVRFGYTKYGKEKK